MLDTRSNGTANDTGNGNTTDPAQTSQDPETQLRRSEKIIIQTESEIGDLGWTHSIVERPYLTSKGIRTDRRHKFKHSGINAQHEIWIDTGDPNWLGIVSSTRDFRLSVPVLPQSSVSSSKKQVVIQSEKSRSPKSIEVEPNFFNITSTRYTVPSEYKSLHDDPTIRETEVKIIVDPPHSALSDPIPPWCTGTTTPSSESDEKHLGETVGGRVSSFFKFSGYAPKEMLDLLDRMEDERRGQVALNDDPREDHDVVGSGVHKQRTSDDGEKINVIGIDDHVILDDRHTPGGDPDRDSQAPTLIDPSETTQRYRTEKGRYTCRRVTVDIANTNKFDPETPSEYRREGYDVYEWTRRGKLPTIEWTLIFDKDFEHGPPF